MKKSVIILVSFSIFISSANLALGDCTDLIRATSWYAQDERTIIYYAQNAPVAKIVLRDCKVSPSSNIRLTKTYMCDEDRLIVDGQECAIITLTSASSGSF
jgi:hypothetical protein